MRADLAQDEQVVDVDHPDPKTFVPQKRRGSDSLERDFDSAAHKHDIGVDPVIGRVSLPDRGTGDAMRFGLFDREPRDRGVLGPDDEADIYRILAELSKGRKGMQDNALFLARRQWSIVLTLVLASAGK